MTNRNKCAVCGRPLTNKRRDAITCSSRCRKQRSRNSTDDAVIHAAEQTARTGFAALELIRQLQDDQRHRFTANTAQVWLDAIRDALKPH